MFAIPRSVTGPDECYFYHTMDIPGHGVMHGEWDLRGREHDYLGGIDFAGKRVLELGAASGALTFFLEGLGADVIAYDLSEEYSWDNVPFADRDAAADDALRRGHLRRINNGFWLAHAAHNSSARLAHGTVYTVPDSIGEVDIATFGSILLHVRDPFLALQTAARLVRETIVVTERYPAGDWGFLPEVEQEALAHKGKAVPLTDPAAFGEPRPVFLPDATTGLPTETWWHLPPALIMRYLAVLGFPKAKVTAHLAPYRDQELLLYTVTASRA